MSVACFALIAQDESACQYFLITNIDNYYMPTLASAVSESLESGIGLIGFGFASRYAKRFENGHAYFNQPHLPTFRRYVEGEGPRSSLAR